MTDSSVTGIYYPPSVGLFPPPPPPTTQDLPHTDTNDDAEETKQCSVRGCTQRVPASSQTKMCETCRGRHRVYASTKRARRKLEKAAVASVVATRVGVDSTTETVVTAVWMPTTVPEMHQTETQTAQWDHAIDPRLFEGSEPASSSEPAASPVHAHHRIPPVSSSTSELANALTLPLSHAQYVEYQRPPSNENVQDQDEDEEEPQYQHPNTVATDQQTPETPDVGDFQNTDAPDDDDTPLRRCSVKGCKKIIPGTYEFKMCPPCRTRYRTYGTTKRAKWKAEREAFDHEMASLRAVEDERRRAIGLGPLVDFPEELRAWEISIIDEQVPLPPSVASAMAVSTSSSMSNAGGGAEMGMAFQIPGSFTQNGMANPPTPARMCTVSHCHQILPGFYRYKRCEQHRLQNRYHSKLKRVREKVDSDKPGDGDGVEIPRHMMANGLGVVLEGKTKAGGEGEGEAESGDVSDVGGQEGFLVLTDESGKADDKKRNTHTCATEGCNNFLSPGMRWRMCDVCRTAERLRKWHAKQGAQKGSSGGAYTGSTDSGHQGSTGNGQNGPTSSGLQSGHQGSSGSGHEGFNGNTSLDPGSGHTSLEISRQSSQANHEAAADGCGEEFDPGTDLGDNAGSTATAATAGPSSWSAPATTATPMTTAPPSSTANLMTLDDPLAFRAYKPKTATSAIGRILAKNPNIGVEVFTDLLLPPGTQTGSTTTTTKTPSAPPQRNAVPTPTVPQSTPFVYQPPPRNASGDANGSNGGIEKPQEQQQPPAPPPPAVPPPKRIRAKTKKVPTTPTTPAVPAPFPATPPYGAYPYPQYPYPYPYYMPPPYGIPPYPYAPPPTPAGQDTNAVASMSTTPYPVPPYPYPYAQQPYGYPPQPPPPHASSGYHHPHAPHAQTYAQTRYMQSSYGQTGQQQQPYMVPPTAAGFMYGPVPPQQHPPPAAAAPPAPPQPPATPAPPPKPRQPSVPKDTRFSYYHYGMGHSNSPTTPNERWKRRKVDPAYLEKKAQSEQVVAAADPGSYSLGMNVQQQQYGGTNETQQYGGTNGIVPIMVEVAPPAVVSGGLVSQGGDVVSHDSGVSQGEGIVSQGEDTTNASPETTEDGADASQPHLQRQCANKSCRRSIPTNVAHTLCGKCKMRFKKHQVKAKQRFKLEPKKLVLPGSCRQRGDLGKEAG